MTLMQQIKNHFVFYEVPLGLQNTKKKNQDNDKLVFIKLDPSGVHFLDKIYYF